MTLCLSPCLSTTLSTLSPVGPQIPCHRAALRGLSAAAVANMESPQPPLFLRFVNLLINDAIFLLDEGLGFMQQIREAQVRRK